MCDFDAPGPQASSSRWVRARKPHRCYACHETVRAGDLYHRFSGIWDGQPDSFVHCARCWKMIDALEELTEGPVALDLNCGAEYVGREDDPLHELAFWSVDDAQVWAQQQKATG